MKKVLNLVIAIILLLTINAISMAQDLGVQKLTLKLKMYIASATNIDGIMSVPPEYPRTVGDPALFGLEYPLATHLPIGNFKNYSINDSVRLARRYISVVIVELRGMPAGNEHSQFNLGWVKNNGEIVDFLSGNDFNIIKPVRGNYYIAVHTPNTFPIMTPIQLSVSGATNQTIIWDFTTGPEKCFGGDMLPIQGTTKWGAIAGEFVQEGIIDISDASEVYNRLGIEGFSRVDFDNNNIVNMNDLNYLEPLMNRISNIVYFQKGIEIIGGDNFLSNSPNPFNPSTKINFTIPKTGLVKLKIYNIMGKEISQLINEIKTAGNYSVNFDASGLSSGTYFYKLETGDLIEVKKMTLIK